jgi:hypothetical protein
MCKAYCVPCFKARRTISTMNIDFCSSLFNNTFSFKREVYQDNIDFCSSLFNDTCFKREVYQDNINNEYTFVQAFSMTPSRVTGLYWESPLLVKMKSDRAHSFARPCNMTRKGLGFVHIYYVAISGLAASFRAPKPPNHTSSPTRPPCAPLRLQRYHVGNIVFGNNYSYPSEHLHGSFTSPGGGFCCVKFKIVHQAWGVLFAQGLSALYTDER